MTKSGSERVINLPETGTDATITEANIKAIRLSLHPARVLAERYGVSPAAINQIRSGETWKHVA